ncbi:DUF4870 domain-containing protein [Rhodoferax aquaticus]|uniref:DUF4870 domain-containing protein n=1 Tax=Rhodoferax aquaticus TaxID=2527691 RepID=A0A515EP86_9BURK|nr:DUF4870 domain-containing protein [Rhodoferax aquaticus]QDL54483.1 DUF4870 domain-containing protein [Rhodoferax aquaticus]
MDLELNSTVSQDSKNLAVLVWVGSIFFPLLSGLLFYLLKSDDAFVAAHAKEALNWGITTVILGFVCLVLVIILIGLLGFWLLGLCSFVFCVLGALSAAKGKSFRTPFGIRLLK